MYKNDSTSPSYSWQYNAGGIPVSHTDSVNKQKYSFTYDSIDRFIRQSVYSTSGTYIGATEFGYDVRNNVNRITNQIGGRTYTQNYSYSAESENTGSASYAKDNLPTLYKLSSERYAVYNYDSMNRLDERLFSTATPLYNNYLYKSSLRNAEGESTYKTTQLHAEFIANDAYIYYYDDVGNITRITKGVRKSTNPSSSDFKSVLNNAAYRTYEYDSLGQMTRENDVSANKSKTYSYDSLGNILSVKEYPYTTGTLSSATKTVGYTYGKDGKNGWNKLLVGVDTNGDGALANNEKISYDAIGNPSKYLGATLVWDARQLKSYNNGTNSISYTYDADGLRTSKTVNGAKTVYQYVDSKLYYQCTYTTGGAIDKELYFFYDSYGNLASIRYFTASTSGTYYTMTNTQGDVLGIYNSSGNKVAGYEYDTWGNVISITDANGNAITNSANIGIVNPIRYRGYCYDTETGFYYLQSRYYNPQVGRFLNADNQVSGVGGSVQGYNLFAYCGNSPVNRIDPSGEAWYHWVLGAAIVVACAAAVVITAGGAAAGIAAVVSVASGAAAATTASTVAAGAFIGSATVYGMAVVTATATSSSVKEFNDKGNWDTVVATAGAAVLGGAGGYVTSKAQVPQTNGKGTLNPKVKSAIERGKEMHMQMDYGPGVKKEVTIAKGCRVDGIDFNNKIIYELKPNNPQAIAKGMKQLERYTTAANQSYGGEWTGVLKLYD